MLRYVVVSGSSIGRKLQNTQVLLFFERKHKENEARKSLSAGSDDGTSGPSEVGGCAEASGRDVFCENSMVQC